MSGAFSRQPSAAVMRQKEKEEDDVLDVKTLKMAPVSNDDVSLWLRTRGSTALSHWTRVWGVRVSVVITEVFGNVVACQLGHNVGDVAIGTEVLQALVSTTLWRKQALQSPPIHQVDGLTKLINSVNSCIFTVLDVFSVTATALHWFLSWIEFRW